MIDHDKLVPPTVVILGIPFNDVSFADTVEWTRQRVLSRRPAYIATVNMDFIMQAWQDPELQRILLEADLVVADGIPIVWLSRLVGPGLKGRVTGSDLVPMLAELAAREGFSLFGLGGAPGVAEKAAGKLVERYPGLRIAGCYSPPKADILAMNNPDILARLAAAAPDILLVAFGAPKQEKWVNLHIRQWRVPVSMGVGGSLDFLAGMQKRAPKIVQSLALEWLWRMLSDPRRLFRRYVMNFLFLGTVAAKLFWLRYASRASARISLSAPAEFDLLDGLNTACVAFPPVSDVGPLASFRATCEAEARSRLLVVDLRARSWLDSRDIGILLELSRLCRSAGRRLYVLAQHPRVARLLRFTRLDLYLCVAETAAAVIHGVREHRNAEVNGSFSLGPDQRLIVALPVELTAANVSSFKARCEQAWMEAEAQGGPGGVTVDASAAQFIDSAAVGFLVGLKKRTEPLRAGFRCFGFRDAARRTLKVARLESLMTDVNG